MWRSRIGGINPSCKDPLLNKALIYVSIAFGSCQALLADPGRVLTGDLSRYFGGDVNIETIW